MLSANGFATSGSYGSIYPSSPRVDPTYYLSAPSGVLFDANLILMAPLITGGLLDAEVRSARFLEVGAREDFREVQADAALRAEDAYLRTLLAGANVDAAKARISAVSELVRVTRAQYEAGKGIEASVLRSESELAQSQRSLVATGAECEKAMLDLKVEIGLALDTPLALSEVLEASPKPPDLPQAIATAKTRRGVIRAAKARLDSATADVSAAEGARKPQVYGVAMADTANRSMNRGGSIGLTVSVPLFDGGARRAETNRMRAMREKALGLLRQAEILTEKEVRQAYIDFATADSNVASAQESVRSAQAAYGVAAIRVTNGKAVLLEQLDSLQSLTQAKADLAAALFDRRLAYVRILRATGEIVPAEESK